MPNQFTYIPSETRFWGHIQKGEGPDACWLYIGKRLLHAKIR